MCVFRCVFLKARTQTKSQERLIVIPFVRKIIRVHVEEMMPLGSYTQSSKCIYSFIARIMVKSQKRLRFVPTIRNIIINYTKGVVLWSML